MSFLNITVFNSLARDAAGQVAQASAKPVSSTDLNMSTTSAQSAALDGSFVRLIADANCRIAIGTNPTATGTSMALRADSPEYFGILPGDKIAAIEG